MYDGRCSHLWVEHDTRLVAITTRIEAAGVTEKCEFNKKRVKFLGHIIDQDGISLTKLQL